MCEFGQVNLFHHPLSTLLMNNEDREAMDEMFSPWIVKLMESALHLDEQLQ